MGPSSSEGRTRTLIGLMAKKTQYDAVVIGSGPNGLAAAIALQREGLSVLVLEAKKTIGGGMRSGEATLPGFLHDICSAAHPMAVTSPFLRTLPLEHFGLTYIQPEIAAAHPLEGNNGAALYRSLETTAQSLGIDAQTYRAIFQPILQHWEEISADILGPLRIPSDPLLLARFGLKAGFSATHLASQFRTQEARALFGGIAAHAMLPLTALTTAAVGLVLTTAGHYGGWPIIAGGTQKLADALAAYFLSLGGVIETDREIASLKELPANRVALFDVSPKQFLRIAGPALSSSYRGQLERFRYGLGAFKLDWALSGPVPFVYEDARRAGTVHLGGTFEEIAQSEYELSQGKHPERPYVLVTQQSLFDPTRAPAGQHTLWAYCHVPNGSTLDMTDQIESQIERYAPGFRDLILARKVTSPANLEAYNANYVGGDINGGALDIRQLFTRPTLSLSPYRTSQRGLYLCSASTPPGGGVHGMCGFHAARLALHDVFGKNLELKRKG
jgi:phytoene dehydrogenase-like protein